MRGPQTATVVGPAGEEIFTDEYARVKVQFHWDRKGTNDENSSCFVRVSSVWAGSGWGFIQIPRIGQEVIVDFIEGDPDKPLITGRVYNGANMPPYGLPGNATQSVSYLAFRTGLRFFDVGYASALAYLLLAAMMVVVTFFFKRMRSVYA